MEVKCGAVVGGFSEEMPRFVGTMDNATLRVMCSRSLAHRFRYSRLFVRATLVRSDDDKDTAPFARQTQADATAAAACLGTASSPPSPSHTRTNLTWSGGMRSVLQGQTMQYVSTVGQCSLRLNFRSMLRPDCYREVMRDGLFLKLHVDLFHGLMPEQQLGQLGQHEPPLLLDECLISKESSSFTVFRTGI